LLDDEVGVWPAQAGEQRGKGVDVPLFIAIWVWDNVNWANID
jgi:hypothetical protein